MEKILQIYLNLYISAIDAIKSIGDLLNESKANALAQLRAYRETKNDSDYSNNGISLLNDALRDGEIAIDRAQSIEEIESVLQDAKNALDSVLTESEENNFDIWELRAKALEELEAFRNELGEDNYGPNGKAQLEDIIMNSMSEVSEASTPGELEQVVQATKEKMQGVLTFKSEYQNEIYSYRNSFVDADYTSDGLSALDAATQKYVSLIMDCLNIDSAAQVYIEAIQTMDDGFDFENEHLAKLFMKLAPKKRKVLEMLFVHCLEPEDVAKNLQCTLQHVYNMRSLALKELKEKMQNMEN